MNTPQVNFRTVNQTDVVTQPVGGISFVMGRSLRGPFNQPDEVISSWPSFVKKHGGLIDDDSALLVKRLLEKGGKVRFSRLGHYTTITERSTLTALKATADLEIVQTTATPEDEIELFQLPLKYQGEDYNNILISISPGTNGAPGYFNINIQHVSEPSLNEVYQNLIITGQPKAIDSNYLKAIIDGSQLVDVVYKDLNELTGQIIVKPQVIDYSGGTDGGAIVDADIIGDSASNTGFHSFNEYDDTYQLMVVGSLISDAVHIAGAAYADNRKDLQYWAFLPNTLTNKAALIAKRVALGFNTKFAAIFAGGLDVTNPNTNQKIDIEAITDIAALAVNSENSYGPWYSFAGNTRGAITNALGVTNNFGTSGKKAELNELAQRQINMIINRDNQIKLWGNFSSQLAQNQESFNSIVRLVLYIQKSLRPNLEGFLEEPADIPTFLRMYLTVKPFFDDLVNRRALNSYDWRGDQYANTLDDLQVNNRADISVGKYKIVLVLSAIVGLQDIELGIYLTQNGQLDFEINPTN